MKNLILHFTLFLALLSLLLTAFYFFGKDIWYPYYQKYSLSKNIEPLAEKIIEPCEPCTLSHVQPSSKKRLTYIERVKKHLFDANFILYPKKLTLIGLKHEQLLEVWGEYHGEQRHITTYPFTAYSGHLGPKFREGDRQIPEGIYRIGYLNPNSKFHLSININYPNAFDKKMAKKEKRRNLGSAIMIHGSDKTVGCIPIGDDKIEELYHLVDKVGIKNTKIILAPIDFRYRNVKVGKSKHPWVKELYAFIKSEMKIFIKD